MASGLKTIDVFNVNNSSLTEKREARQYFDGSGTEYLTYPRDSFWLPSPMHGWDNWKLLSGSLGIGFWIAKREKS